MIKTDLIKKVAAASEGLSTRDVESVVNAVFDEISRALAGGDRIELRGFGTFSVRQRAGRTGRNPRTGEPVQVAAKNVPHFKAGKPLKDALN